MIFPFFYVQFSDMCEGNGFVWNEWQVGGTSGCLACINGNGKSAIERASRGSGGFARMDRKIEVGCQMAEVGKAKIEHILKVQCQ